MTKYVKNIINYYALLKVYRITAVRARVIAESSREAFYHVGFLGYQVLSSSMESNSILKTILDQIKSI